MLTLPTLPVEVIVQAKTAVNPFETSIKIDMSKVTQGDLFHKLAAQTLLQSMSINTEILDQADANDLI